MKIQTQKIRLEMKNEIDRIRNIYGHDSSSHAFVSLFIWKKEMGLEICIEGDAFIVKYNQRGENTWFFPCGNPNTIKRWITQIISEKNAAFYYLRQEDVIFCQGQFPQMQIEESEADTEYIYNRKEQECLVGKHFHAQKNHINRIKRDYALECKILDDDTLDDALEINRSWHGNEIGEDGLKDEYAGEQLLVNWKELGIIGVVIYVNDVPYALDAGYSLGQETFDLALAKQKEKLTGLSVFSRNQLITILPEQYSNINAEEDLGIQGLRMMKEQMRPIGKIKMYSIHKGSVK